MKVHLYSIVQWTHKSNGQTISEEIVQFTAMSNKEALNYLALGTWRKKINQDLYNNETYFSLSKIDQIKLFK